MKRLKLDREERDILNSYEKGEWHPIKSKDKIRRYVKLARNTFKKDKRINIRLSRQDLEGIQAKAAHEGIPYQTLIASLVHKFILGRMISKQD